VLSSRIKKANKGWSSATSLVIVLSIVGGFKPCLACPTPVFSNTQNTGRACGREAQWMKKQRSEHVKRTPKSKNKSKQEPDGERQMDRQS
jgi:hypothetical protein